MDFIVLVEGLALYAMMDSAIFPVVEEKRRVENKGRFGRLDRS